jgi:diguanylate cyclase (GGDEF)-like protein/PAS domain S-box-containing protein
VENGIDLIAVIDDDGLLAYVSPSAKAILGWSPDDLVGTDVLALLVDEEEVAQLAARLGERGDWETPTYMLDVRVRHVDGSVRELEGFATDKSEARSVGGIVVNLRDVTDARRGERALRSTQDTFRLLINDIPQPVWVYDLESLRFVEVNRSAIARSGQSREAILDMTILDAYPEERVAELMNLLSRAQLGDQYSSPAQHQLRDGRVIDVDVLAHVIEFDGRLAVLVIAHEVTDHASLQAELRHRALHDELTGLANRALICEQIGQSMRQSGYSADLAVVMLDLDHFKMINDVYGHPVGDDLLVSVADRLRGAVREGDIVGRFGGDEFVVVLRGVNDPAVAEAGAAHFAAVIAEPLDLAGKTTIVTASFGVAMAQSDEGPEELLRNADVAMYAAKDPDQPSIKVFQPAMRRLVLDRLALESDLRRALDAGEFVLHYQPTISLRDEKICGVEALVRWQHPTRGLVPPCDFIDLAEATGLIVPLGEWVLNQACADMQSWQARFPQDPPLSMSVNLSAKQIQTPDIIDVVAAALAATKLPAETLVLEITETVLLGDTERILKRLGDLKALGVRLALDDFGTGYSSMSYLHRFPIDIIKVDKMFIDGVHLGAEESAFAKAMIRLGQTLGLETVAEGVESAEQASVLSVIDCDIAQGYFFARPLDAHALEALMTQCRSGHPWASFRRPHERHADLRRLALGVPA